MDAGPLRNADFQPSGQAKRPLAALGDAGDEQSEPDSLDGNGRLQRPRAGPDDSGVDTR